NGAAPSSIAPRTKARTSILPFRPWAQHSFFALIKNGYSITNRHFLPSGRVSSELAASVQSIRCFVDICSNKAAESEPSPAPGARRQASVFETGIQGVAQAVAQQVEAQ